MRTTITLKAKLRASLGLTLLLLSACSMPFTPLTAAPPKLERITVERGPIENHVVANGRVVAQKIATLAFSRAGRIIQVNVQEGDSVQKGQVLAVLDTRDLELSAKQQQANYISVLAQYSQTLRGALPTEIRQAQSELVSAGQRLRDLDKGPASTQITELQASMQQVEAEVRQAQAAYDTARRENPAGIGASPEAAALEQKTIALQAAKARLEAIYEKPKLGQFAEARAQVAAAQAKLIALNPLSETLVSRQAQAEQAFYAWQQAEQAITEAQLTAPFDGLIMNVVMTEGDIAGGSSTVQLADFAEPTFEADVDEADFGLIDVDQFARVRLQSAIGVPISATIKSIGKIGHPSGSLNVYRTRLTLEPVEDQSEQPDVLLNMSGIVQIVTESSPNALLVPVRALTLDENGETYTVQRALPGTVSASTAISSSVSDSANALAVASDASETVQVEIGMRNSEVVEIVSGLNEGDVLLVPAPNDIPLDQPTVN